MTTDNKCPMTDAEIDEIANDGHRNVAGGIYATSVHAFARAILAAQPAQAVGVTPVAWMGEANGHEDVVIKSVTKPYNMENAKPLGVIAPVPAITIPRMQFRFEGSSEWLDCDPREGVVMGGVEHRIAPVPAESAIDENAAFKQWMIWHHDYDLRLTKECRESARAGWDARARLGVVAPVPAEVKS